MTNFMQPATFIYNFPPVNTDYFCIKIFIKDKFSQDQRDRQLTNYRYIEQKRAKMKKNKIRR